MKRKNSVLFTFIVFVTALFAESAVAKLQKDARECVKPRFSKFTPPNLSEVAPGSTVSFVTNYSTGKATIEVTAKGIPVKDLRITDNKSFYKVEFELPESLENTYARLHLKAQAKIGPSTCKHRDGWLLKISGSQPAEPVNSVVPADSVETEVQTAAEAPSAEAPAQSVKESVSETKSRDGTPSAEANQSDSDANAASEPAK